MTTSEKAIKLLKYLPRLSSDNLVKSPFKIKKVNKLKRFERPYAVKSNEERQRWHPLGYEPGRTPWYLKAPAENYYKNFDARRQYPPLSLHTLQMLIDTHLVDTTLPIDLATICNSNHFDCIPSDNHYGAHLTDEGLDEFVACVNIEVQYAREPVIAAIERSGGRITTAYFDIKSVSALCNPYNFFQRGEPIPKRLYPPRDAIDYYTNPKNRGYLADPEEIEKERFILSQKYGYEIPEIKDELMKETLTVKKHPRQIFFGLEPGYYINLKDKEILEPDDEELLQYYRS